ncbi:MAG: hypothetical protein LC772_12960, partial [Chloroflexi bacterium]|nr:hypothetical protein [Chloroflexota bacterium]
MKFGNSRWLCAVLAVGIAALFPSRSSAAPIDPKSTLGKTYVSLAGTVRQSDLQSTITTLSSLGSRIPGYPGYEKAADYVESQMKAAGLTGVTREDFQVAVPLDRGASLTVGGRTFPIFPLWPNQIRTSQLPRAGLTTTLIDGGNAKLTAFTGRPVEHSIVLLDFDSGADWVNAPRLGASAVIFVEPRQMLRGEAEAKWVQLPLTIPRFYIHRSDAALLRALVRVAPMGALPGTRMTCGMRWTNVTASDPVLKRQVMVVNAYYDDMSTIPSIAPGAEQACGMAGFLSLARTYAQPRFRPKRSVLFIADGAHFEALAGMRHYMDAHFDELQGPPMWDRFKDWVGANSIWLFIVLLVIFGLGIYSAYQRVAGLYTPPGEPTHIPTTGDRIALGIWAGLALAIWAALAAIRPNHLFPLPYHKPADTQPRWYAFTALDLSTRNQQLGVFYKGMFYDFREDIQRNFSDFARSIRENVELIVPLIGEDKDKNFADGVNPISGKNWRSYIPGKIALDNEPVSMAGGIGVAFVTTSDTRPFQDTPSDTTDRQRLVNLYAQVKLLSDIYYDVFNDSNTPDKNGEIKMPLTDPSNFGRMTLQGGFGTLYGRIVQYVPQKSFVPNTPIPGSLAVLINGNKTLDGVRGDDVQLVRGGGDFDFIGVA